MKDVFYISGKKELIFRKEGSVYVSFDPLSLTFLRLNFTASEILFKISENTNYESIIEHFCKKYKITEERISKDIDVMLEGYRCKTLITEIIKRLNFPSTLIKRLEQTT